jgi:hypothetical protein
MTVLQEFVIGKIHVFLQAWTAHHKKDDEHEYISIQKPLFETTGFTSKQVIYFK